jgi:deoxyribodipyrimidine photolyase-related protein
MDGDKPIGGKWSFDSANRSRFESDYKEAKAKEYPIDKKIKEYIDLHFASHLGELKSYYPVNRKEAQAVARKTINSKLLFFGKYQDAISDSVMYGYHTNLSALINIGLLAPKFIIDYAISKYNSLVKKGSHTEDLIYMRNSTEALIRQIIGWREYMRYMYYIYKDRIINGSVIRGTRSLGSAWYTAKTNLPTIDSAINKCLSHAYLHHIERLMLINNIMVIDSIRYRDVYRWFMRMFIDSYDWVMATNLMMNTNSSNQSIRFMTRMYICSASYIKKMSNPGYLDADTTAYLNNRYKRFMIENHNIAIRDYGLASSAKRIEREAQKKKLR